MPGVLVVCAVATMRIVGSMLRVRTVGDCSRRRACGNGTVRRLYARIRVFSVIQMPAMRVAGWGLRRGFFGRRRRLRGFTFRVMWIARLGRCLDSTGMRVTPVLRRVVHRGFRSVLSRSGVRVLLVAGHNEFG